MFHKCIKIHHVITNPKETVQQKLEGNNKTQSQHHDLLQDIFPFLLPINFSYE